MLEFAYSACEDREQLFDSIVESVLEVIDPQCSSFFPCPRDWTLEIYLVDDEED